jgi:hypothetical protein
MKTGTGGNTAIFARVERLLAVNREAGDAVLAHGAVVRSRVCGANGKRAPEAASQHVARA